MLHLRHLKQWRPEVGEHIAQQSSYPRGLRSSLASVRIPRVLPWPCSHMFAWTQSSRADTPAVRTSCQLRGVYRCIFFQNSFILGSRYEEGQYMTPESCGRSTPRPRPRAQDLHSYWWDIMMRSWVQPRGIRISFVLRVHLLLWHRVMESATVQMCAVSGVRFLTNEKRWWEFYIRLGFLWRMFAHRASKSDSTVQLLLCAPYWRTHRSWAQQASRLSF